MIKKAPNCALGAVTAGDGAIFLEMYALQSFRQPSAATSLYTREAFLFNTFYWKGSH